MTTALRRLMIQNKDKIVQELREVPEEKQIRGFVWSYKVGKDGRPEMCYCAGGVALKAIGAKVGNIYMQLDVEMGLGTQAFYAFEQESALLELPVIYLGKLNQDTFDRLKQALANHQKSLGFGEYSAKENAEIIMTQLITRPVGISRLNDLKVPYNLIADCIEQSW